MGFEPGFAPYAPKKAVLAVIGRYRERGLPDPLTLGDLERIGIAATMASRTHQALRFLGLIDDVGNRTDAFEAVRQAGTDEYPAILGEIVRSAYAPVFTIVNPATDGDIAVADAFRKFEPANQRDKMISLFNGLCQEAGISQKDSSPRVNDQIRQVQQRVKQPSTPRKTAAVIQPTIGASEGLADAYGLISAIIQQLPKDRRWTPDRRDRWIKTMGSAVDLLIEVTDANVGGGATPANSNQPSG